MNICVCLSVGRNPVSGRPRMAASDRVALEIALSGVASVSAVHAGDPGDAVLLDYLGMGLTELTVIEAVGRDAVEAIACWLAASSIDLVLTGQSAETGGATGMFPYFLAERLGWPIVKGVCSVASSPEGASLLQTAPGGQRRRLTGPLPAVLVAAPGVLQPRMSTFAGRRTGTLTTVSTNASPMPAVAAQPARKRGARLRPAAAASRTSSDAMRTDLTPQEAARLILETLDVRGLRVPAGLKPTNERPYNV